MMLCSGSASVEDGRGSSGLWPTPRFPTPLIKPDKPLSGIRLSDWFHRKALSDAGACLRPASVRSLALLVRYTK
jgi:hypothetical protein